MDIPNLVDAVFLRRENRFAAKVLLDGQITACHVPNSGRLRELLVEGAPVRVTRFRGSGKTACGLVMVQNLGHWVVIDAHRANAVAHEAVLAGLVPGLENPESIRREVTCGNSRFDMACTVSGMLHYVEVKCSTLQENGVGMFPDAPTERGWKHLKELTKLSLCGTDCHVLFVMQHPAAQSFRPHWETDPVFARLLGEAIDGGVRVHALVCDVNAYAVAAVSAIPIIKAKTIPPSLLVEN